MRPRFIKYFKHLSVFARIQLIFTLCLLLIIPAWTQAQELVQDKVEVVRAVVVAVVKQESRIVPGTDLQSIHQTITAKILEGQQQGQTVTIENDFITLKKGDKFFALHTTDGLDGRESYAVQEIDRRGVIVFFVILFAAVVLIFSGAQGVRSLLSLAGSFFIILYVLVPGLLQGYPPVLTSVAIAAAILFLAIFLTHGFNRESVVAFSGTVLAVILTGILAYAGVYLAHLSGFASEEAVYLNLNTGGALDFTGLLLGGIMIGVLGVLDDIAITQAAIVSELYHSAPHLSKREVYKKALRVGREHVGALVNTLALAYTGAALPLLLLFSTSESSFSSIINREIFATEIVRAVVGSIGLIMTVPITTLLAIYILKGHGSAHTHSHIHTH